MIATDVLIRQLQGHVKALEAVKMYGPFTSAVAAANIVQDGSASITYVHNLGLSAAQQASLVMSGHLFDGFFAHLASWRFASCDANSVTFLIGNPSGRADVRAGLKFWLFAWGD